MTHSTLVRGESAPDRDHGGNLDAALAHWGGTRSDWIDLSTGINPQPYPVPPIDAAAWTALPDSAAQNGLVAAARAFWNVPDHLDILPANGASALIAALPAVLEGARVHIPAPTYNEHAAAFAAHGWDVSDEGHDAQVLVHPNNPDGRVWSPQDLDRGPTVIDESFADCLEGVSLLPSIQDPGI